MATYAAKVRSTAVDNATIRLNATGEISAGGIMEPFSAGTKGGAPSVFYVDSNVVSSGNGLGWLSAVKTVSEGLAMAHAYMSTSGNRAWGHRATVYCCGDNPTENLVILAEKTDVIGVGSSSAVDRFIFSGNHVPVTTTCWGCRFFNIQFRAPVIGIIWDLTAPSHGIKFLNCHFLDRGTNHTHAIRATVVQDMEIGYCRWYNYITEFDTGAIVIGAGDSYGLYIHDNTIVGKVGILIDGSALATGGQFLIDRNIVISSTETITDNSGLAYVTNNQLITNLSTATTTDGYTGNLRYWSNNILTGWTKTDQIPFISESE